MKVVVNPDAINIQSSKVAYELEEDIAYIKQYENRSIPLTKLRAFLSKLGKQLQHTGFLTLHCFHRLDATGTIDA